MKNLSLSVSSVLSAVFFGCILMLESCVDHDLNDFTCDPISYEANVDVIITTRCAIDGCHNGDNGSSKNWTDFSLFQAKAQSGVVKARVVSGEMPPPDREDEGILPLNAEQIRIISCWIDQGAKAN